MASRDTITISSSEEDVETVLVTKQPSRKRRKISYSAHTKEETENKDDGSRDAANTVSGSSAIIKTLGRARSADIPTSSFESLPILRRLRSAPLDRNRALHVPTSLQHGLPDRSFPRPDARPSTPIRQSSIHLNYSASYSAQQAYPTPKTNSPSFRRRHFEDLTSDSYVASISGRPGLGPGAGEQDLGLVEGNRQVSPEIVLAKGLDDRLGPATRTRVSNAGIGGSCSTSTKNSKAMKEAPVQLSEAIVQPSPKARFASSIQSAEGSSDYQNTRDVVKGCENNRSNESKKRKIQSLNVESTVPQPRIRNRILWSTPAYQAPNNDHSRSSPISSTTDLAANDSSPRQSLSTVSQESRSQKSRRTWTCKMYADLAQQLQESFSFADFARKYSRPEHEVFDLFSAVVHLPLLQKSSTGISRVAPQGHQSVKTYRTLVKETKTALANEGKKEEKEPKKPTASLKSFGQNQGSRKAVEKTPFKNLLATAMTVRNHSDAC